MRRFFVPPDQFSEHRVVLRGSDVNHIRNVLRLKEGDRICVLDGNGQQYQVRLTALSREEVEGEIESRMERKTESPLRIVMGQALIKGNRFDNLVRKAVELGVHTILPVQTRRCVARPKKDEEAHKMERWRRIANEAAKQCGRTRVPEIGPEILTLEAFSERVRDVDLQLLFWENESTTRLRDLEPGKAVESVAFLAGPEGGWDPAEAEWLIERGFHTVGLGPRTLRADSVSLVILALLQQQWGDL